LPASHIGLRFIVRDDQFDRATIHATGLVDAINSHLDADQRGFATGGSRA
jgi:hypothetical protein